ncbi:MAG: S-layer homology domain-containing protein [Clostridia bacterium]|nr:S-layer homology domain-containing protein [Clostridia bacterium]
MKKIVSLLICAVMLVTALPLYSTAAGGRSCPMELTKPTNATLQWLMGGDSPTTSRFSYTQPAGVTAFVAAKDRAHDEGTEEAFWAATGYDDIIITTQIDWAIDDPTDWKYNANPEAWDGRYGFGHIRVGTDEEYEDRYVVGEWEYVDDGFVGSEATREEWVLRGFGGPYEDWCDSEGWTGDGAYKPGLRDQLKEGQYEITEDGLVIDWDEHTAYVRVRYVVIGQYWNDEGMFEDFYYSDWSDPASYGKDAVRWEPPTEDDVPAPVISNFRMTDEEFNDWPVIAYTLDVPEDFLTLVSEVTGHGGYAYVETFCRELGKGGEWISIQGDGTIRSGENKWYLVTLSGTVEMTEYTSLELKTRYVVEVKLDEPGRKVEYTLYSDFSNILTFKGKDVPVVHDHVWGELIVDEEPTCTAEGKGHYICEICEERWDVNIPANGHTWTDIVVTLEPNCTEYGLMNRRCQVCGEVETDVPVDPLGHDTSGEEFIDDEPTCTEGGTAHTFCVRCRTRLDYEVGPLGHAWGEPNVIKAPTCTETGRQGKVCTRCGEESGVEIIPKLGHDYSGEWAVRTEPTCTKPGLRFTKCTRCDAEMTEGIRELGHDYAVTVVGETCTAQGYTLHKCSRCEDEFKDNYKDALGHDWDEGKVTKEPTLESEGVLTHTCNRCGDTYDERMMKLLSNTVEIFDDVSAGAWYVNYVDYAYSYGLMNGVSGKRFDPQGTMTRAMLVTVLWRIEGEPKSTVKCPFADLTGNWYREAVAWAFENEIVNGMSETKFAPNNPLTREQIAAIIYRYASFKGNDVSKTTDITGYPDYKSVSGWAVTNMKWAVAEGLISGVRNGAKNYLAPKANATRAQVAAILMRYLERK